MNAAVVIGTGFVAYILAARIIPSFMVEQRNGFAYVTPAGENLTAWAPTIAATCAGIALYVVAR